MARVPRLLALPLLAACAATTPGDGPHRWPDLPELPGEQARVQADLEPQTLREVLRRIDALERALGDTFPFLELGAGDPGLLTLVVQDPARYALLARDHGLERPSGAFVCRSGEVIALYRDAEWRASWAAGPPWPLEPRVRPLASALVARRLMRVYGSELPPTWLEEGLAQVFVELVAEQSEDRELAARERRERLLDAYLPLFLGEPPALRELVAAPRRETGRQRRAGARALSWAAVRFLLGDPARAASLDLALRRASGEEAPPGWAEAQELLGAAEDAFEAGLRDQLLGELLETIATAATPADRWEAAGALRLVANLDIDADVPDELRQRLVQSAARTLAQEPPPQRLLLLFQEELGRVRVARSRLQAMEVLKRRVARELDRRARGFGHPAVENARRNLGRNLERVLRDEG